MKIPHFIFCENLTEQAIKQFPADAIYKITTNGRSMWQKYIFKLIVTTHFLYQTSLKQK